MNFEWDIEQFVIQWKQKNIDKAVFHPIYEVYKIQKICSFILKRSEEKYPGLEYHDREVI